MSSHSQFGLLTEREVDWLVKNEWVRGADDILWRRSKLGLHLSQEDQDALRQHFEPQKKAKSSKRAKG